MQFIKAFAFALPKRITLQWRHNERDGVSNHWRLDRLLNCLFRRRSKKTPKFRVTGLCKGNLLNRLIPLTKASNAENVPFDDVIMKFQSQTQTSRSEHFSPIDRFIDIMPNKIMSLFSHKYQRWQRAQPTNILSIPWNCRSPRFSNKPHKIVHRISHYCYQ